MPRRFLCFLGTRPEAIKLAPVIAALRERSGEHRLHVVGSGQHRELFALALGAFDVDVDQALDLMLPGQTPTSFIARALPAFSRALEDFQPDVVIVQGDTSTAFAGAMAAHLLGMRVAHVEAGLRTSTLAAPWPEESFRRMIARLADVHFAPTEHAAANLAAEGVAMDCVHVTGNTVVDALRIVRGERDEVGRALDRTPHLLATFHRRESRGAPMAAITDALLEIADRSSALLSVVGHPSPHVRPHLERLSRSRVEVLPPLGYPQFLDALAAADLVLTDSGGVQEEAPSLGTPVLVMRPETDRPEIVSSGWGRVVGTGCDDIVAHALAVLEHRSPFAPCDPAPFGDGFAATRIVAHLLGG